MDVTIPTRTELATVLGVRRERTPAQLTSQDRGVTECVTNARVLCFSLFPVIPSARPSDHDRPFTMSLNLSKFSFKRRLESFYSAVAPELLPPQASETDWLIRFEEIYKKYAGTVEGEFVLQAKLAKKYGDALLLEVVSLSSLAPSSREKPSAPPRPAVPDLSAQLSADALLLRPGSGDLSFTSRVFDAYAALCSLSAPPLLDSSPLVLDNVEKCRSLLPATDDFYVQQRGKRPRRIDAGGEGGGATTRRREQLRETPPPSPPPPPPRSFARRPLPSSSSRPLSVPVPCRSSLLVFLSIPVSPW